MTTIVFIVVAILAAAVGYALCRAASLADDALEDLSDIDDYGDGFPP